MSAASVQASALRTAAAFIDREGITGLTVTVAARGSISIAACRLFTLIQVAVAAGAPAPAPDGPDGRWRTTAHLGQHRLAITSTRPEGEPA